MTPENEEGAPIPVGVENAFAVSIQLAGKEDDAKDTKAHDSRQSLNFPARYRNNATGETSRDAATMATKTAKTQRERVLNILKESGRPLTAEQITEIMVSKGFVKPEHYQAAVPSTRPRLSESARLGLVRDSGKRGDGLRGARSIAWELVPESEREAAAAKYRVTLAESPISEAVLAEARKRARAILAASENVFDAMVTALSAQIMAEGGHNG